MERHVLEVLGEFWISDPTGSGSERTESGLGKICANAEQAGLGQRTGGCLLSFMSVYQVSVH